MENLDKEIGLKLKKIRESKGLSVREVAERIDVHFTYISKIERGQIPSVEKLNKLCNLYGISLPELFGKNIDVPEELKTLGVEWVRFIEEMEEQNLTPEQIKNIVDVINSLKK
jgi:XRE family transcriptional regulator of biofilm formation